MPQWKSKTAVRAGAFPPTPQGAGLRGESGHCPEVPLVPTGRVKASSSPRHHRTPKDKLSGSGTVTPAPAVSVNTHVPCFPWSSGAAGPVLKQAPIQCHPALIQLSQLGLHSGWGSSSYNRERNSSADQVDASSSVPTNGRKTRLN